MMQRHHLQAVLLHNRVWELQSSVIVELALQQLVDGIIQGKWIAGRLLDTCCLLQIEATWAVQKQLYSAAAESVCLFA